MSVMSDEKIEPVKHVDPGAKIWLHRKGTLGMVSTKGKDDNQTTGENGRIVIGVNKQEEKKETGWRFYDSYKEFTKKKVLGISLKPKAKEKFKSLGEGSNIVIEKDKIWVRFGKPDQETAEIKIDKKGIVLYANKGGDKKKQSKIELLSKTGAIRIDNEKPGGAVRIKSKSTLDFETSKNIILNAKTSGSVKVKSKQFEANRNLKVM